MRESDVVAKVESLINQLKVAKDALEEIATDRTASERGTVRLVKVRRR